MSSAARVFLGFLVAPAVPAALLYVSTLRKYGHDALVGPMLLAPFAYAAAIAIGIPLYFVIRRRLRSGPLTFAALGALIGMAFYALVIAAERVLVPASAPTLALAVRYETIAGVYGALSGVSFWLIAIRRSSTSTNG
jgi:hypothetical protein